MHWEIGYVLGWLFFVLVLICLPLLSLACDQSEYAATGPLLPHSATITEIGSCGLGADFTSFASAAMENSHFVTGGAREEVVPHSS